MPKKIDLTGKRFGRLTVICESPEKIRNKLSWMCRCDCGKESTIPGDALRSGNTRSCGCLHREELSARAFKHGMRGTRVYRIWRNMQTRCLNPNCKDYRYYGGRGITVCQEWRDSFEAFHAWAMANGYADDLTIDRIDTNGNYCPENCRWATMAEQNSNKHHGENPYRDSRGRYASKAGHELKEKETCTNE